MSLKMTKYQSMKATKKKLERSIEDLSSIANEIDAEMQKLCLGCRKEYEPQFKSARFCDLCYFEGVDDGWKSWEHEDD